MASDMRVLRVGMAQMNATVGDFDGNLDKMLKGMDAARSCGVDLLTFPEMPICGYPPEDLVYKPTFIEANLEALRRVIEASKGLTTVVGFIEESNGIYNAAAVIHDGQLAGVYRKIYLPNYGVFDEKRYFGEGNECPVFCISGVNVGISICEDMWFHTGPFTVEARSGAEVLVNISASPYHKGKRGWRELMMSKRAADNAAFVAYNNLVGGQDELVFDGGGVVIDPEGGLIARGEQFSEDMIVADIDADEVVGLRSRSGRWKRAPLPPEARRWLAKTVVVSGEPSITPKPPLPTRKVQVRGLPDEVYDALVLSTRDYIRKNGFEKVIIGLSGGIDSSLVAVIAVDAIGASNVIGVTMPSRYSSAGSVSDSESVARNLDIELLNIPIEPVYRSHLEVLGEHFEGTEPNVAEENLQARIRGNILMALSNKFGWLVLATGHKSEMATGYATLYGDMAGGFAVIKDVPKTLVYELAMYRNSIATSELIPASVIEKPPSAELRPEQQDTDSLPPYEVLDPILTAYVEEDKGTAQIVDMGFDGEVVERTIALVDRNEYKRRQAPPGVKITPRAFGRDRRLPITSHFKNSRGSEDGIAEKCYN